MKILVMSRLFVVESLVLVILFFCSMSAFSQSSSPVAPDFHLLPSPKPDRIILNLSDNPLEELGVNWRTDTTITVSHVEFAIATAEPEFRDHVQSRQSVTETLISQQNEEPTIHANYHQVKLDGLKAGRSYVYRVGGGDFWSEWFQFTIPEEDNEVNFLYFGDAQNEVVSMFSRVMREAIINLPKMDFTVYAGDLINHESSDFEWGDGSKRDNGSMLPFPL